MTDEVAIRLARSIAQPRLERFDAESMRFLRLYDAYCTEMNERARLLLGNNKFTTDLVTPTSLKYWVYQEQLEAAIALGFAPDAENYDKLWEKTLRQYLDSKTCKSPEHLYSGDVHKIVKKSLSMDVDAHCSRSRMEMLIKAYNTILRNQRLLWMLKSQPRLQCGTYSTLLSRQTFEIT